MNQDKLRLLDRLFAGEMEAERIKGAALLVERRGRLEFHNVYGTDREDSIYKIYSMTKPVTAVAAMLLYERGLIDLYDPVDKYLAGYGDMKVVGSKGLVPARSKITVRQVLNMTSGLVYPGENSEPERIMEEIRRELYERARGGEKLSNLDICNELAKAPLLFQPGEYWHYGISADVVAGIVEAVSGISYGEFLRKEIFEPLEMTDTGFYVEESKMNRLAVMYSRVDEAGRLKEADEKALAGLNLYAPSKPPYIESGGGGLYSTVEDYRHFVQMLAAGGSYKGRQLIGKKTMEYITANQLNAQQLASIDFDSIDGYGYGNLMRVMLDPGAGASNGTVGEYGWDGLPGTYFMVDPKEELILIYMQQIEQGADQSLRRKMRQIVYAALED